MRLFHGRKDACKGPNKWRAKPREEAALLFGGYIVSDNPANSGDTITIQ
ncbi:MAG: hypothetical protein ACHQ0Y_04940 [Thermodesulfovibrionales bacterium]